MEPAAQLVLAFFGGIFVTIGGAMLLSRLWLRGLREKGSSIVSATQVEAEAARKDSIAEARLAIERERATVERQTEAERIELDHREKTLQSLRETVQKDSAKATLELERASQLHNEAHKQLQTSEQMSTLYRQRLRNLSGLSEQEVREALRGEVKRECEKELVQLRQEIIQKSEQDMQSEAKRILVDSMQRLVSGGVNGTNATLIRLPNEEMKGRIIGREGRNIKSFESTTGVTLMIDETPDTVLISSFDPVRRETARIALESLVREGRIHPASIEEAVAKAHDEMLDSVIGLGEEALRKLRLTSVHPEVVSLLGKLHYRLSNNQNTLDHSVEVAYFSSLLASELGLDPEPAKRAGIFHDMGKAIDHEYEGSHAIAGARMLQRFGEDERVVNAVAAHHQEVDPTSVYAGILMVADGISATRPGARSDSMDGYIQRVRALEQLAREEPGVKDAFAVQAGREIRVIVEPDQIDDAKARALSRSLRARIEQELQYPGTIKVTVIREQRFSDTAK
ncbi:MAG: ribonuclease Y [Opitutales bacterium]